MGNCLVWFEHGQTEDYGNTTSNETKENGQSFSYNLGGTPTLYEYYEGGFIDGISIYGAISSGQTFTVGATGTNQNHYFGRIGLRLRRIGNPGNILVGIKATNAGSLPTGDFLTYTYYDSSQIGSMNWYYIDFSDIYQLTAGTKYALILKCPNGDGGNYINWEYNSISASYPGGNRIWTITNGSSWSHDSTVDLSFREYELIPLSPGTLYHYRAVANSNISTINGSDFTLLTKPYEPNTFSSSSGRARQINLTWTKGNGANTTYIIRKNGSFPNNRSDGTLIYNNTGNSYYDIGLTPETEYYQQIR